MLMSALVFLSGALSLNLLSKSALESKVVILEGDLQQQQVFAVDYQDSIAQQEQQIESYKEFIKVLREQSSASAYDFSKMRSLIEEATQNVADIRKLEEADKQLLAKYSKVSFLNEHYEPDRLAYIPSEIVSSESNLQVKTQVQPFVVAMFAAMEQEGLAPRVISAYRSFGYQGTLKSNYTVTYGTNAANQFSADQGYSEHQLGTTVDIVNATIGSDMSMFDATDEYQWLLDNAHIYGFTLSYPTSNSYYKFEPWHWRFVGVALATNLYEQGKYFYDLPQRDIDSYRLKMFDN